MAQGRLSQAGGPTGRLPVTIYILNHQLINLRNTENPEKLSIMVTTDKKEYIHHNGTIHLRNTSLPYKTIIKTTNKYGLGAIKPRQRPNMSPTNYLYTKPSTQST